MRSNAALVGYASVFFGAMVLHELALEGASAAFLNLNALASLVSDDAEARLFVSRKGRRTRSTACGQPLVEQ